MVFAQRLKSLVLVNNRAKDKSVSQSFLQSDDLLPVPPNRRVWTSFSFVSFWLADSLNINTLMLASTAIASGLPWWSAWIAIILGYSCVGLLVAWMAHISATYHISFPILARSSFGVWGAAWPVLNRVVMACIWFGVQSWLGGQCITLVLRTWIPSYANMPNGLPESSGTKTYEFVSFFLFCLIQLPIVLIRPESIRYFFYVKAVVVPTAIIALFVWSIVEAHGLGPIVHQPATISGSEYGWAWMTAMMNCLSNFATLIVNIPDVGRLANSPRAVRWPQIIAIPACFGITSFIGIIVASSSRPIFGDFIWNPLDLLKAHLDRNTHHAGVRAGVFFIAASLIVGQIGTNISANSLAAGHDLAALIPQVFTIRRGALLCAIVGFAMCPWHLLSSSSSFSTYLSAYSLFLSSIAGTIFCDYYFVRRGVLRVADLYTFSKSGAYRYWYGINWRGFASYIAGIAVCVTGFAGVLGANVSLAAERIYILAYPLGLLVSMLIYLLLNTITHVPDSVNITRDRSSWLGPKSWEDDSWFPEQSAVEHQQQQEQLPQLTASLSDDDKNTLDIEEKPVVELEAYQTDQIRQK